jgi:hypothetical protein
MKHCLHSDQFFFMIRTPTTKTMEHVCQDCGTTVKKLVENIAPVKGLIDEYSETKVDSKKTDVKKKGR